MTGWVRSLQDFGLRVRARLTPDPDPLITDRPWAQPGAKADDDPTVRLYQTGPRYCDKCGQPLRIGKSGRRGWSDSTGQARLSAPGLYCRRGFLGGYHRRWTLTKMNVWLDLVDFKIREVG